MGYRALGGGGQLRWRSLDPLLSVAPTGVWWAYRISAPAADRTQAGNRDGLRNPADQLRPQRLRDGDAAADDHLHADRDRAVCPHRPLHGAEAVLPDGVPAARLYGAA